MRSDGEAYADLARALGDRYQHDVHDADAADQKADASDGAEHAGHGRGGAGHGVRNLGHVADGEVVLAVGCDTARVAQDVFDAGLDDRGRRGVVSGDIDGLDVAVAGDAALERRKRHQNDIVLVLAKTRVTLGLKHADDAAAHAADTDGRAIRFAGAEELLAHRLADQADIDAAPLFRFAEWTANRDLPVAGIEKGIVGAGHRGGQALGGEDDADLLLRGGRDGAHAFEMRDKRCHLLFAERADRLLRRGAWGRWAAGANHQKVAAELGDVGLDLFGGAAADGQHGDDGGDADDDAEQRQERTQRVAADGAKGEADGFPDHARTAFVFSVSEAT